MVKEADALAAAGYQVTVLYAYWNEWGTRYDEQILPLKQWIAIRVAGDPQKQKLTYFMSRLIHKIAVLAINKLKIKLFADVAIARGSFFLSREAKKHKADIYIGHNLGALPATVKAAKANKKPCGFDAEDFHRFEGSDDITNNDVILKTYIEDKYILQLSYLSASSPLITEAYHRYYPEKQPVTVLNVFPLNKTIRLPLANERDDLKLFWFSQTIGANRGIEDIVNALQLLKGRKIELHLLGYINTEDKTGFINQLGADNINLFFHDPLSPDELVNFASQFDIGLATETGTPYNRDICLTNKIFTYMQAGLAIIASDTAAQVKLLNTYPAAGKIYPKRNSDAIASLISGYDNDRESLYNARISSLLIGRDELNWEKESPKLLNSIKSVISAGT